MWYSHGVHVMSCMRHDGYLSLIILGFYTTQYHHPLQVIFTWYPMWCLAWDIMFTPSSLYLASTPHNITMHCNWYSHDIHMISLCSACDIHMVSPCIACDIHMISPCSACNIHMVSMWCLAWAMMLTSSSLYLASTPHNITMHCKWYSHDITMLCMWYSHGVHVMRHYVYPFLIILGFYTTQYHHALQLILTWYSHDITMLCMWYSHGITMHCMWYSHDITLLCMRYSYGVHVMPCMSHDAYLFLVILGFYTTHTSLHLSPETVNLSQLPLLCIFLLFLKTLFTLLRFLLRFDSRHHGSCRHGNRCSR